ncbi:MAG: DEAD/DEAH box helicase [Spirochaetales bacterium]|nr:DEAD/DEAH box helicase [Spirochaetales bacterium]
MTFTQTGLKPELLGAINSRGYTEIRPIQARAIPAILDRKDVLGGAQTGTGKTAAFALPILHILSESKALTRNPRALVLTPTRELADQVGESFRSYGKFLKLKTAIIYGGVNIKPQIAAIRNGIDIVVATPGRLLDHHNQHTIDLSKIEILVLDEADRMLDMGFIRDIKKIIGYLPEKRQNLLFSATYTSTIKALADNLLHDPVSAEVSKRNAAAEKVEQFMYGINEAQKLHLLAHLIKTESWYQVLVFVRTKHRANQVAMRLDKTGIPSAAIHGNKSQAARTRTLNGFKNGDIQALIATDIAARGLHLENLSHVVNYDLPHVPEDYIHRIGRTGRAGKSGIAVSLVSGEEKKLLQQIQLLLKGEIALGDEKGFKPVAGVPREQTDTTRSNPRRIFNNHGPGNFSKKRAPKKPSAAGSSNYRKFNGQNKKKPSRQTEGTGAHIK